MLALESIGDAEWAAVGVALPTPGGELAAAVGGAVREATSATAGGDVSSAIAGVAVHRLVSR